MKNYTTTTTNQVSFLPENETSTAQVEYVVYETTNTITGETYTGVFSFDPATRKGAYKFENYIGQGITYDGQAQKMKQTAFTKNVSAYGFESFQRTDIFTTTSEAEAYTKEAELCNEDYVALTTTLNQRTGGKKGKLGKASRKRMSINQTGANNPMAVGVICTESGKIFGTIKEASEALEVSYGILKYQLSKNNTTYITKL